MIHRRAGHHRGGLRHGVPEFIEFFDMWIVELSEVIPDGSLGRNNVRLITAVENDVVRSLLQPQMLATEFPSSVHQGNGVESTASFPRSARSVSCLAVEKILNGDKPTPSAF